MLLLELSVFGCDRVRGYGWGLYAPAHLLGARLPQSCAVGQGLYLRSLDHLGRSCEAKDPPKKTVKVKCDGQTDG